MSKKLFEVAVEWSVCGTVKLEAESLEEAMKAAEQATPLSVQSPYYIDDSWSVNEQLTEDLNLEVDEEEDQDEQ